MASYCYNNNGSYVNCSHLYLELEHRFWKHSCLPLSTTIKTKKKLKPEFVDGTLSQFIKLNFFWENIERNIDWPEMINIDYYLIYRNQITEIISIYLQIITSVTSLRFDSSKWLPQNNFGVDQKNIHRELDHNIWRYIRWLTSSRWER